MTILDLQPKEVWRYFDEISRIPRGSGNEAAVREHIIEFAKVNSLYYKVDDAGNLILRKAGDATKGKMLHFTHTIYNETENVKSCVVKGTVAFVDHERIMHDIPDELFKLEILQK